MSLGYKNRLTAGVTVVSNEFIDRYLAGASGEYVKVYLYLLRHGEEKVTMEAVAEALQYTEADVRRALAYWQQAGVLEADVRKAAQTQRQSESGSRAVQETAASRCLDMTKLENDETFKQLIFITEQYLNKAGKMTATDCQILANLYSNLKMEPDLLEYLMEYCAQNNHFSLRYAEKVALNWHEKKITTVEEARTYSRGFSKESFAVMKAMGLTGRNPADSEYALMEKWFRQYGFTREIVVEACSRTIRAIHSPSFQYADRILSDWKEAGVRTFSDIAALDKKKKEKDGAGGEAGDGTRPAGSGRSGTGRGVSGGGSRRGSRSSNRFHNLEEHGYDYDEMVWNMINPDQETGGSDGTQ
ncbi:MAG: DnaD domain protein [Clostridium sp.]|nr:DnaD domain protein [Clostridiaceae bacterium]MDD6073044.1 DnaD domain protein [Clostridium sp.]MDY5483401.1 DnaD domain protein [Clostridium sp.]